MLVLYVFELCSVIDLDDIIDFIVWVGVVLFFEDFLVVNKDGCDVVEFCFGGGDGDFVMVIFVVI